MTKESTTTMITLAREKMLSGGIPKVLEQLENLTDFPYASDDLQTLLLRDVIAYTFLHNICCHGGACYGSFLPAHFSGLDYGDINFQLSIIFGGDFLKSCLYLTLGIRYDNITVETEKLEGNRYGKRYLVICQIQDQEVKLYVELQMKKHVYSIPPSTLGSTLIYTLENQFTYRTEGMQHKFHLPVNKLIQMLKMGKDIKSYDTLSTLPLELHSDFGKHFSNVCKKGYLFSDEAVC